MYDLTSAVLFRIARCAFFALFPLLGCEDAILAPLQSTVKPSFDIRKSRIGLPLLCSLLAVHSRLLSFYKRLVQLG